MVFLYFYEIANFIVLYPILLGTKHFVSHYKFMFD